VLQPEIVEVARALMLVSPSLDPAACLVLRTAALYPHDIQFRAMTEVANEQARREGAVDADISGIVANMIKPYAATDLA